MLVLGIESSCDETAVALYDGKSGLVANRVFSQVELHRSHGGVVPELASREHIERLLPMIEAALADAELEPQAIDGIAYTAGPGLIGALLVGACLARSLGYAWGVPVVGVHHLEGHLLAPALEPGAPEFPFVALQVSGGHTLLVEVQASVFTGSWAKPRTTPRARPSTRRQNCSASATREGPRWRRWPSGGARAYSSSRARCSTGRASISASAG